MTLLGYERDSWPWYSNLCLYYREGTGEMVWGTKFVLIATRHPHPNSRFIIDVAHSSPASVDDVLAINPNPVIVSHTGVKGACDTPRNLADEQMQRIAAAGGLIGIGFWNAAVCDISPGGVAQAIKYAIDLVGLDHVALAA